MSKSLKHSRFVSKDLQSVWCISIARSASVHVLNALTPEALTYRNLAIVLDFLVLVASAARAATAVALALPQYYVLINFVFGVLASACVYQCARMSVMGMFCATTMQAWAWVGVFVAFTFQQQHGDLRVYRFGVYPVLVDIFLIAAKVCFLHIFKHKIETNSTWSVEQQRLRSVMTMSARTAKPVAETEMMASQVSSVGGGAMSITTRGGGGVNTAGGGNDDDDDGDRSPQLCLMCNRRPRNVVFKNCGHSVCCSECVEGIDDGRCPVCGVEMAIKPLASARRTAPPHDEEQQ